MSNETHITSELAVRQRGQRLKRAEEAAILKLLAEGLSVAAVSRALKVSETVVYELRDEYTDTAVTALAKLRSGAAQAADDWIAASKSASVMGNHKPSKDLLAAVGVIKDQPETAIAVQVNVPGQAMPRALQDLDTGESGHE